MSAAIHCCWAVCTSSGRRLSRISVKARLPRFAPDGVFPFPPGLSGAPVMLETGPAGKYGEILQEVRVAQTGVQILFAFLLTLAFQARFGSITGFQRHLYVVTMMLCATATALLIAPSAFHRVVYRRRLKQHLVQAANRLALAGMVLLLSLASAVLLVMDVVLGLVPAIVLAAALLVWFGSCAKFVAGDSG